ncbi:unnamed protein product [Aureobasidium mustum]|uniref:HTH araC/xylS-type domain-containing protein n=1 Tax=Aureobasidium mustum TaxID=2773714 RepID=A0A9N8K1R1_9PEZI|nr:unnamed protein product [Aureobasidium mustum]
MSTTIPSSTNHPYNVALPILPITTPSRKWHALATRTSCPTLPFYYGVLATKIYCRPTCTARLARRANVIYFTSAQAAQSAGYRACKRCRPDDELFFGEAEEVVMRAMAVIGRLGGKSGLQRIAAETEVTRSYLCRVFKKTMGMTVGAYIREFEMEGKSDMLTATSVAEPEMEFGTRAANGTQLPGASNEYR